VLSSKYFPLEPPGLEIHLLHGTEMTSTNDEVAIRWWFVSAALLGGLALSAPQGICADPGKDLFLKHCASCHGKDGKARTPVARKLGVKDLSQSKLSDEEIQKQVVEGRRDKRGNLKMPSFKEALSNEEIKLLVAAVKTFRK
jgi:mono/diheme cytochrome c family protein